VKKRIEKDKAPKRSAKSAPRAATTAPTGAAPHQEGKWAEWFVRDPGEQRYWLVKSEPGVFSFDALMRSPGQTVGWDGVRNLAARNFLRDGMKLGDRVFFYHSSTDPQAIVGICEVVREGYPDATAFDAKHDQYDDASSPEAPVWYQVDLRAVAPLERPVTLSEIKGRPELSAMALVRIGRLSVTPVSAAEWTTIMNMGAGRTADSGRG
jgi:predicted RNA-binding protein with PUA-like domain